MCMRVCRMLAYVHGHGWEKPGSPQMAPMRVYSGSTRLVDQKKGVGLNFYSARGLANMS